MTLLDMNVVIDAHQPSGRYQVWARDLIARAGFTRVRRLTRSP